MTHSMKKPANDGKSQAGYQYQRSDVRNIPRCEEYEKNIIGCILKDGMLIDQVVMMLNSEDFYEIRDQIIFGIMLRLRDKGVPIDIHSVSQHLKEKSLIGDVGDSPYLVHLAEIATSPANLSYQVAKVKEASIRRSLGEKLLRIIEAIERRADRETKEKLGTEIENLSMLEESNVNVMSLANYQAQEMAWLLEKALPGQFPSIMYGDGGLGKSYLGLYFAILVALGEQKFLGLRFPEEPLSGLYVDWELDIDEFSRRALKIVNGLGLSKVPSNLYYYSPDKSLYKLLPELKGIISARKIRFLIIDSLGAACVDPDNVGDIVEVFSQIKGLGIATLILDHQSKMQSQDNYNVKTPYGSVYKYNLSRSVFQLSCAGRDGNHISLMLRHKKSNFGRLLHDLIFDLSFEGDKVMFVQSSALTPEEKEMMLIHEAMVELEGKGERINQKILILQLKGILGKDRIISLLDKGVGIFWDKSPGEKREIIYKPKILISGYIYKPDFRILENEGSEDEIETSEVIA
ncbi:MAG: AAA family ATPase [Candidatus Dadabacteria bacterium]|nr:AAA family ATPase [Candidatus Dadabacteria bacterium]